MNRDRHSHRHGNQNNSQHNNWKNNQSGFREDNSKSQIKIMPPVKNSVTAEQVYAEEEAIKSFKNTNHPVCKRCGKPIIDIAFSVNDRNDGQIIHFDCAIEELGKQEHLEAGDKIVYIGQGRFGVINYPNVHDTKHFVIKKIIEWEQNNERASWRTEISDLYSQVR